MNTTKTSHTHIGKLLQIVGIALIAVTATSSAVRADFAGDTTLGIKFDNNQMTTSSLMGVPAVQTQNWNFTGNTATGTFGTLNSDTGGSAAATSVTGTWASSGTQTNTGGNPWTNSPNVTQSGNSPLYYGELDGNAAPVTLTFAGLNSFAPNGYSLYIYDAYNITSWTGTMALTGAATGNASLNYIVGAQNAQTWAQSTSTSTPGDYLLFTGLSGNNLTVTMTPQGGFLNYAIQAVEFVANPVSTPEPSTYALLLGGIVALGFCVRRRQSSI